jgi:hypothetical protein
VNAFPVPVTEKLTLQVNAPVSGEVIVTLTDVLGSIVMIQNIELQRGINDLTVDMGTLTSGLYQVGIKNGMTSVTKAIVK